MSWVEKKALVSFVREIGGTFTEFQHEFTWYGWAKFQAKYGVIHCDYALGGSDGIQREEPIIGFKQFGNPRFTDEHAKRSAYKEHAVQILACKAAIQWNPKLDGEPADKHAVEIMKVDKVWSVARVKIKPKYGDEEVINVWYICTNKRITSLPRI